MKQVLGFGQVLWDLSVYIDFSFLKEIDMEIGGHQVVDKTTIDFIAKKLSELNKDIIKNSGGSCANVMSNMAKLGSNTGFCGKHGDDDDGREYMEILRNEGVKTHSIIDKVNSTGQLLSLITPDKDRAFIVYRGASDILPVEMVDEKIVQSADIIHIEGYLITKSVEALWKIFEESKKTTFDLAAYAVIENDRPILQKMMKKHPPQILFSNLPEGKVFTQKEDRNEILDFMLNFAEIAVLTLGEEGVLIKTSSGKQHFESAIKTQVADTTGAGDSFSAGFLHEFLKSEDIQKAAQLGVRTASTTIRKLGARSFQLEQLDK